MATMCIDHVTRQQVLDALGLQWCRRDALAALSAGETADAEVVASGDVAGWSMRQAPSWKHLLSTRTSATGTALARSLPVNRKACGVNGLSMVSVFDLDSTEPAARSLLEHESLPYYYAFAPLQIKIVDQRQALAAARRYWDAVGATAIPCRRPAAPTRLTDRQYEIFDLMLLGRTDESIARILGISVRTVRGDIGAAEQTLGVNSRLAAGFAYATHRRRIGQL